MLRVLQEWALTPWRLAVHEPTATAVIADVHLGYREARRASGEAVPGLSMRDELEPLRLARQQTGFRKLVVAGDLFERRVEQELLAQFVAMLGSWNIELTAVVPGNHDRGWQECAGRAPMYPDGVSLGDWHVVHDATDLKARGGSFVFGHWHPALGLHGRRVPCYLAGPRRLVLPAFSQDAVGQDVSRNRRWRGLKAFAIQKDRVVDCGVIAPQPGEHLLLG